MSEKRSKSSEINNDRKTEQPGQDKNHPRLVWDMGTAYDLFISLVVLHHPEKFGLRPSWAAGVRSRLSGEERKTLEESINAVGVPSHWIYALPEPKDSSTAIWALRQLAPGIRLQKLSLSPKYPETIQKILLNIAAKQSWNEEDLNLYRENIEKTNGSKDHPEELRGFLDTWAHSQDFGERYIQAIQSYYQVFFAEEERQVASALKDALERAREMSEHMALADLLEELTQGLHIPGLLDLGELVLAPSYWSTPLIFLEKADPDRSIIIFGSRRMNASLIPGEVIPDALLRGLKALADPTRLRILRYLVCERVTPAEISRRLRLRAPTVTHHLSELRLAGLVHITFEDDAERRYAARMEGILGLSVLLEDFLQCKGNE